MLKSGILGAEKRIGTSRDSDQISVERRDQMPEVLKSQDGG